MMFRLLAPSFLVAACAAPPSQGSVLRKQTWSSSEEARAAVQTWAHGTSSDAPLAVYVAIPESLSSDEFDRINEALRSRGYWAPHSEPSMLDVTTEYTARVALADPVEQPDVFVKPDVARQLWLHDIPFGIEGGNSNSLIIPRRAVPLAQRLLAEIIPPATRWRQ